MPYLTALWSMVVWTPYKGANRGRGWEDERRQKVGEEVARGGGLGVGRKRGGRRERGEK